MLPSVESLCNALARHNLMRPELVRLAFQRWNQEAGPAASDLSGFTKWLTANQYATAYQLGVLQRSVKRPKLTKADRLLWAWLCAVWNNWQSSVFLVKA